MPTYKNNTESRIVDQEVIFDPDQTKSTDKISIEEILGFTVVAGAFVVGEKITGASAEGVVVRFNSEDSILELAECDVDLFVIDETITGADSGATGTVDSSKIRLTRTDDEPYYIPVTKVNLVALETSGPMSVGIDIDNVAAVAIACTVQSVKVSLNDVANVVKTALAATDPALIIATDGNINAVILSYITDDLDAADVYQFSSVAQAEAYFA